jgi:hypothetical protein
MEYKKLHKWTAEEEAILKAHFYDLPFSSHKESRFTYLKRKLALKGFDVSDLTEKAISRKTYRLGLKSIEIKNEDTHVLKCSSCGVDCVRPLRYKRALCDDCTQLKRHTPKDRERTLQYYKYWRQQQKEKGEIK